VKGSRIGDRLRGGDALLLDGRVVADAIILDHAPIASTSLLKKRRRLDGHFGATAK